MGKQVKLQISGADTLMDGEVLNELIDPLMHVLRNAVDHGIESPEQRSAAGKPAGGNIWLDFLREGNSILVRCRDDGAGLDYAAIRRAAENRGLLEPSKKATEEELRELLLMPPPLFKAWLPATVELVRVKAPALDRPPPERPAVLLRI